MSTYKYVCNRCRSANIYQRCEASWDVHEQSWLVSCTLNNYYCHECDRDTNVDKVQEDRS
jgi:hypothetical protein